MARGKIIGIDLGTTNSIVAVMQSGKPVVIPSALGDRVTPSVVALDPATGQWLVGMAALQQATMSPQTTIRSVKRLMGRRIGEIRDSQRMLMSYKIKPAQNESVRLRIGGTWLSPQEISAMILEKLKADAEAYLGESVERAVITVPSYFNDSQRQGTREAGQIAGLTVERIINESTAASLAYGLDSRNAGKIGICHFGGGTFDVSILEVGEGVYEVKSTSGDTEFGGDDFDQRIIDRMADQFEWETGVDLRSEPTALARLKEAAEQAKCRLSRTQHTEIDLPFIHISSDGPKNLTFSLTRTELEAWTRSLLERISEPCKQAMGDAKVAEGEIDKVVLVGAQTRMPAVQELIETLFGRKPCKGLNPDEAVALGAAVHGGVLAGDLDDVVLLDVTPFSLGIEGAGGVMTELIHRNTTIPTCQKEVFTTACDNQASVDIRVLQGEREMATDNRALDHVEVGIPPAPRGIPQIEVTFDIDWNGILNVSARDLGTGIERSIEIRAASGLPEGQLAAASKGAEKRAEEERKRRELIDTMDEAERLIYAANRALQHHGDMVSAGTRAGTDRAKEHLIAAKAKDDVEGIKEQTVKLRRTLRELVAEAQYEEAKTKASLVITDAESTIRKVDECPLSHGRGVRGQILKVLRRKLLGLRAALEKGDTNEILRRMRALARAVEHAGEFARSDGQTAEQALVDFLLVEQDPQLVEGITEALGQIADQETVERLVELVLKKHEKEARERVVGALLRIHDERTPGLLIEHLMREGEEHVRCRLAEALSQLSDESTMDRLVELAVNEEDEEVRRRMAQALGQIDAVRALDLLAELLIAQEDQSIRRRVADALMEIDAEGALDRVARLLVAQDDAEVRDRVRQTLDREEAGLLRDRLAAVVATEDDEEARQRVALILEQMGGEQAAQVLIEHLMDEEEKEGRGRLAHVLREIGCERVMEQLVKLCMEEGDQQVRERIVGALVQMHDERAPGLLIAHLIGEEKEHVRCRLAEALGQLSDESTMDTLVELALEDGNHEVRRRVAHTLGHIAGARASDRLAELLIDQSDQCIRRRIVDALMEIDAEGTLDVRRGIGRELAVEELVNLCKKQRDQQVRERIVQALVHLHDQRTLGLLIDHVTKEEDAPVRRRLVEALSQLTDESTMDKLVDLAVEDDDREVRCRVGQALGQLDGVRASDRLAELLIDQSDQCIRRRIMDTLMEIDAQGALDRVAKLLVAQDDPEVRDRVTQTLDREEGELLPDRLAALVATEDDEDARQRVTRILEQMCGEQGVQVLIKHLLGREEKGGRGRIVDVLREVGREQAIEELANLCTKEHDQQVRQRIGEALAQLGDERTVAQLVEMCVTGRDEEVRVRIAETLGYLEDRRMVAPLLQALRVESDKQVRRQIRRSLRRIGGWEVKEKLKPRTWLQKLLRRRQWVDS